MEEPNAPFSKLWSFAIPKLTEGILSEEFFSFSSQIRNLNKMLQANYIDHIDDI